MAKQLTERQQEIMALLDQGKTPKEVGDALEITENAVYQHVRRIRANGNKVNTSGSRSRSRSRSATKPRAATPRAATPTPTPAPSEPRLMTPLQAIRARKDALAHDVRETDNAVTAAERTLKQAQEAATKVKAKHGAELKSLETAEAAITGKPAPKARPARKRPAAKRSTAKPSGNGSTPAAPQGQQAPTPEPAPTA